MCAFNIIDYHHGSHGEIYAVLYRHNPFSEQAGDCFSGLITTAKCSDKFNSIFNEDNYFKFVYDGFQGELLHDEGLGEIYLSFDFHAIRDIAQFRDAVERMNKDLTDLEST